MKKLFAVVKVVRDFHPIRAMLDRMEEEADDPSNGNNVIGFLVVCIFVAASVVAFGQMLAIHAGK